MGMKPPFENMEFCIEIVFKPPVDATSNQALVRNASRLALESREAMFRRAMTLLSARCTSLKQGLDPEQLQVPFGVQVPKYFYVTQEKPLPMEPLKAWRGYHGNVYFEPIQVNPLKNPLIPDTVSESPKDSSRTSTKQTPRRNTESDKGPIKLGPESRSESRQTVKSTGSGNRPSPRQMAILDKQAVISRFNESLHEDIVWLEGQENTGSLAIRPRTQPNKERKKDLLYNKERICKGSVAHRLYVEKHTSSKRPRFAVSGGKFTPPNSMSPLLRTQTQYSLSSNRLTTNSPDLYHLNDSKLPPLDQIKASLKHSEGSREKTYTRSVTITEGLKPSVKYSPDVVAKFAQQAL